MAPAISASTVLPSGPSAQSTSRNRGLSIGAEADQPGDPGAHRRVGQAAILRVVAVEDRGAVRFEPEKDLGLGVGNGLDRGEIAEMNRLDRGDQCDVGPHQAAQRGDLGRMIYTELKNPVGRV